MLNLLEAKMPGFLHSVTEFSVLGKKIIKKTRCEEMVTFHYKCGINAG